MRLKHYLLLALTMLVIAFFQPFIVFLGNLIVIGSALAYVYSDLSPEAQDAYEQKLRDFMSHISSTLRRHGAERNLARLQKKSRFSLLRRKPAATKQPGVITAEQSDGAHSQNFSADKT